MSTEGLAPTAGQAIALAGSLLILLAAVGVLRFDDVLARMHALSKASVLGIVLVLGGAALTMSHPNDWTSLVLAMILQVITSPVSANLISRSVHRASRPPAPPPPRSRRPPHRRT